MALFDGLGLRCYIPSIPDCTKQIGFSLRATENLRVSNGHLDRVNLK